MKPLQPKNINFPQIKNVLAKIIPFVAIFFVGVGTVYFFLRGKVNLPLPTPNPTLTFSPLPKTSSFNFLLLGYGGAGHAGGSLTDVMIIVHIDTENKRVALISVPRDLWIPSLNDKINAAYPKGNTAKEIVSEVTGLPISYFVSVDFGGFIKIIDTLGKVNVNVPQTFEDNFFPIKGLENDTCGKSGDEVNALKVKYSGFDLEKQFTCRYEQIHFDKGVAQMSGSDTLKFVRSRHSNTAGGDFARSQRQFTVLAAIMDKLISFSTGGKLTALIDTLSKIVRADLGKDQILELVQIAPDPKSYQLKEIHLTDQNVLTNKVGPQGQFILIPRSGTGNWTSVQSFIKSELSF